MKQDMPMASADICPWADFAPATISFCEQDMCAWIAQPANAWSNVTCVIAAYFTFRLARKKGSVVGVYLAVALLLLAFGSFLFHATGRRWGEVLDIGAMYLISSFAVAANVQRWINATHRLLIGLFAINLVTCFILLQTAPRAGSVIFAAHLVIALAIELRLSKVSQVDYKPLLKALIVIIAAFAMWVLDYAHIFCDPHRHWLSGHALWHGLAAVSLYFFSVFYIDVLGNRSSCPTPNPKP